MIHKTQMKSEKTMPHYNSCHLQTLKINETEFNRLDDAEQKEAIKKAYRKRALILHPDKTGGSTADEFKDLNAAYTALTEDEDTSTFDPIDPRDRLNRYVKKIDLHLPKTGFDFFMETGISKAADGLLKEFDRLDEEEKKKFAEYYAPFINLARQLQENEVPLAKARFENQQMKKDQALLDYLLIEARKLVIRLFGEEYKDDFSYREFVGLGFASTKPIFATRKLLNPLKWVAAILAAASILTHGSADYLVTQQLEGANTLALVIYALSAPILATQFVSELLASPVNQISRPLSELTGLPPEIFTSLTAAIAASIIYQLLTEAITLSALTSSALLFLPYVNIAICVYSLRSAYELYQIAEQHSSDSLMSSAVQLMILPVVVMIPSGILLLDFMCAVAALSFNKRILKMVNDLLKPGESLLLAEESVSEEVRAATLNGYQTAYQSHLFFNTPKDAVCENHPSFLQQTGSFFGVSRSKHEDDTRPWNSPGMGG